MYLPPHFERADPAALQALIERHPLGALVTQGPAGLDANHIPFHFEPEASPDAPLGRLIAHVARANPLWQPGASAAEVLVIFQGPEGYVSPNWYPSKHEAHRQVPTWNYEVVHAHGRLTVHDDARFVRGVVARLTRTHEAAEPRPWKMGDSAPDFIDEMLQRIVGIEITLTRLVGKAKLSQNKDARDRGGAIEALERVGNTDLADAMRATLPPEST
jgi:transcriptional regulator